MKMDLRQLVEVRDEMRRRWPWLESCGDDDRPDGVRLEVHVTEFVVHRPRHKDDVIPDAAARFGKGVNLCAFLEMVLNEDELLIEQAWSRVHERIDAAKAEEIAKIERMGT